MYNTFECKLTCVEQLPPCNRSTNCWVMITIFPSCMVGYPSRPKWDPYVVEEVVVEKEPFIKDRIPNAIC